MCFKRDGVLPALQLSAFPLLHEPGVRYFRGSDPKTQELSLLISAQLHPALCFTL